MQSKCISVFHVRRNLGWWELGRWRRWHLIVHWRWARMRLSMESSLGFWHYRFRRLWRIVRAQRRLQGHSRLLICSRRGCLGGRTRPRRAAIWLMCLSRRKHISRRVAKPHMAVRMKIRRLRLSVRVTHVPGCSMLCIHRLEYALRMRFRDMMRVAVGHIIWVRRWTHVAVGRWDEGGAGRERRSR